MAKIASFEELAPGQGQIHSDVHCGFKIFTSRGSKVVQLDTYGSDSRQIHGKVSQSIQLDREGAENLLTILETAFPGISSRS